MDQLDINKLIADVAAHYKQDIGSNFAKAVSRLLADLSGDLQKKELLHIIALLVDELLISNKGHYE